MQRLTRPLAATALITAAALLAGCAASPAEDSNASPESAPTGEITFWSAIAGMDLVTEAFNNSQDDIQVTFQEIPNAAGGGLATLAAAISAGDGPDVAGFDYTMLPQFVGTGAVVPLDDYVSPELLGGFSEEVLGLVAFEGATYGLPYDAPPLVMYYRQDVLEAAGVGIPTTWEEFEEAARAVRAANPGAYIASFNPNEAPIQAALAWQAGARWFEAGEESWNIGVDGSESMQVAEFWQRMIDEDLVKVQLAFSDEWTADLAAGVTNGVVGASWSAAGIRARTEESGQAGKWVAAVPPTWGGAGNALLGGTAFSITSNSENPAAAAKFVEFLTTDPAAIEARGEVGSAYLAYPGLSEIAEGVFPTEYFANDIYAVFDEAYAAVLGGWQWGPNWEITATSLRDALSALGNGGTVPGAYEIAQTATVSGLRDLGISVAE